MFKRLWHWWLNLPPSGKYYDVYGWDRWLRRRHPDVARLCERAKEICAAAYPAEEVQYVVVRAVEEERAVVAVVAHEPRLVFRGRPPYHLWAIKRDLSGWEQLADEPPYCFFGIK